MPRSLRLHGRYALNVGHELVCGNRPILIRYLGVFQYLAEFHTEPFVSCAQTGTIMMVSFGDVGIVTTWAFGLVSPDVLLKPLLGSFIIWEHPYEIRYC